MIKTIKMKKGFWVKKIIGFMVLGVLAVLVFGFVVMSLWNAILPAVLGVKTITFVQALGIFVLSKLLFGGFRGGGGWGRKKHEWRMKMQEKWQNMSADERRQWKENMRGRCRNWGDKPEQDGTNADEDFSAATK
jgi:Ca2+/H+ antiporter, TMEM165/GDT1 family